MVTYLVLVKDFNVLIWIKVDEWITIDTLPRYQDNVNIYSFSLECCSLDIVWYLYKHIICNINMCFFE